MNKKGTVRCSETSGKKEAAAAATATLEKGEAAGGEAGSAADERGRKLGGGAGAEISYLWRPPSRACRRPWTTTAAASSLSRLRITHDVDGRGGGGAIRARSDDAVQVRPRCATATTTRMWTATLLFRREAGRWICGVVHGRRHGGGAGRPANRVEREESGWPRSSVRSSKAGAQRWRWLGGCRPRPSPPRGGRPPPFRSAGRRALARCSAPPLRSALQHVLAHRRSAPPTAARSHAASAQPLLPPPVYFERAQRRHRGNGGCASVGPTRSSPTSRGRWSAPRPARLGTRSGMSVARTRQPSDDH
uniref:Uncharacterized protein n=1 Tax=Oryza meridionalis TaxID=40149 RepID=A0A0E0ELR2_9ORYZ